MTLLIARHVINRRNDLSEVARICLDLIDGGQQWLDWALQSTTRFAVHDETHLVIEVQQGLHGTPSVLLPGVGLCVGPAKLMTLSQTDIAVLAEAETGSTDNVLDSRLQHLLNQHGLVRQSNFATVRDWLDDLDIASAPIFQSLDLADNLALYQLLCEPITGDGADSATGDTNTLTRTAAKFAVQQARSATEFTDYLRIYLSLPESSRTNAEEILQNLLLRLFDWLECPQIAPLPSPVEILQGIKDWRNRGHQLGFSRISLAALRILQHTGVADNGSQTAPAAIWAYMQATQAFLATGAQVTPRMNQDGRSCTLDVIEGSQQAHVMVDANGVISLEDYSPNTATQTVKESQKEDEATTSRFAPKITTT